MYIKIKNLKKFLLFSSCLFFAGFNYLTYVKADETKTAKTITCDKQTDTDCDGLTNSEEKLYKTNPENADTDRDGYSDAVEIKSGYDPTKPAPGDRVVSIETESVSSQQVTETESELLTTGFIQELQDYTNGQENNEMTASELQSHMTTALNSEMGDKMTWESLSATVDKTKIKTLNQTYPTLSSKARQEKIKQDSYDYTMKIGYLIDSNLPVLILGNSDLETFGNSLKEHLFTLTTDTPDIEYFVDLGNRLELFSNQMNNVEVPETMLAIHIKLLGFVNGLLSMREVASPLNDPLATMVIFSKVYNLTDLASDFLANDVQSYFNQK